MHTISSIQKKKKNRNENQQTGTIFYDQKKTRPFLCNENATALMNIGWGQKQILSLLKIIIQFPNRFFINETTEHKKEALWVSQYCFPTIQLFILYPFIL